MTASELYTTILVALVGGLFAIVQYFVKRELKQVNDALAQRIERREFDELRQTVAKNTSDVEKIRDKYLTKDDFYREQNKLEQKIDRVIEMMERR